MKEYASMKQQIKCRMGKNDYYDILDLQTECSMDDIKRSYKKLALRFHPDKNTTQGAKDVFNKITNAYSKLSNVETKAEYDEKSRARSTKTAFSPNFNNNFSNSAYYPFGNQSRFSDFSFRQKSPQERQEKKRKQFQQQKEDIERQFEKIFRKFFQNSRQNQRSEKPKPYQYQKNQEKQYTERMKRQYQQQKRAQQIKERAKKEKEKKKNIIIFFLVLFSVILFGPSLFSSLDSRPSYSFSRNSFYNVERKTKILEFPYFMNEKYLIMEVSTLKLEKIEQIVDRKMIENLKKQCINSKFQKKSFEDRAYKQKIGRARSFYLEQASKVQMQTCDILFDMALKHMDYMKSITK